MSDLTSVVSNVLIIMKTKPHIEYLSRYMNANGHNVVIVEVEQLNKNTNTIMSKIRVALETNIIQGIIVSSEIDNYKVENLPDFFQQLRDVADEKPILLLHPSRIHPADRELIKQSVREPFGALQGHDLEFDKVEHLAPVLDTLFL